MVQIEKWQVSETRKQKKKKKAPLLLKGVPRQRNQTPFSGFHMNLEKLSRRKVPRDSDDFPIIRELLIPSATVGFALGKQGSNVVRLEDMFFVKIHINIKKPAEKAKDQDNESGKNTEEDSHHEDEEESVGDSSEAPWEVQHYASDKPIKIVVRGFTEETVEDAIDNLRYAIIYRPVERSMVGWTLGKRWEVLRDIQRTTSTGIHLFTRCGSETTLRDEEGGDSFELAKDTSVSDEECTKNDDDNSCSGGDSNILLQIKGLEKNVIRAMGMIDAHQKYWEVFEEIRRLDRELELKIREYRRNMRDGPQFATAEDSVHFDSSYDLTAGYESSIINEVNGGAGTVLAS